MSVAAALFAGLAVGFFAGTLLRARRRRLRPTAAAGHDVLQHAIDVAHDGMAVYDADLRLVAWNRAYCRMFDLPPDLVRAGVSLRAVLRSNAERGLYGDGSVDVLTEARFAALTRHQDYVRVHVHSSGRVLEMRSAALRGGGLFLTYKDATAQVTSEEELEAQNSTLERRVRERTEELEHLNVQLIRAKAEAEDANVSKSRFLAAASHDLLQPLSAARLYTASLQERLRATSSGDTDSTLVSNIDESLEAVEDILGALLEISQLDAGATKTDIASVAIADVFRQLQMEFEPLARARQLRLDFCATSSRVLSDRKLLRRMLQNLISNAVKYTPSGRVLVGVRRAGSNVRIEIHDTGIGIPLSKQLIVFREFERLPAAIEVSAGAGLGLSIVERLGRVLQHDVNLRSIVGRGTMFSVSLPLVAWKSVQPPQGAPSAILRQRSLEGLVVAAIDNEPQILLALEALLNGWDCTVAKGVGLQEIMVDLERIGCAPDVIVADYHVGDADGLGIVTTLRKTYGHVPAIIVTADRSADIRSLIAAADVRLLLKPLKPAALRAFLTQWHLVKTAQPTAEIGAA